MRTGFHQSDELLGCSDSPWPDGQVCRIGSMPLAVDAHMLEVAQVASTVHDLGLCTLVQAVLVEVLVPTSG